MASSYDGGLAAFCRKYCDDWPVGPISPPVTLGTVAAAAFTVTLTMINCQLITARVAGGLFGQLNNSLRAFANSDVNTCLYFSSVPGISYRLP